MINEIILLAVLIFFILLNIGLKNKLPDRVGIAFGVEGQATGKMKRSTWVYLFYPLTCFFTYIFPFFTEKNYFIRLSALIFIGASLGFGVYLFNAGKKLIGLIFISVLLLLFIISLIILATI